VASATVRPTSSNRECRYGVAIPRRHDRRAAAQYLGTGTGYELSVHSVVPEAVLEAHQLPARIREAHRIKREILQMHTNRASVRVHQAGPDTRLHTAVDDKVSPEFVAAEKADRVSVLDSPILHDLLFGYRLGGQDTMQGALFFPVKQLGVHPAMQATLHYCLREVHAEAAL